MVDSELQFSVIKHRLGDREISIAVPSDPDQVLNHALRESAGRYSDPYWGILWPAAIQLAAAILQIHWLPSKAATLELGCGAGLPGIAAMLKGHDVTFSDVVPEAVELAVNNAARNGFAATSCGLVLDWNCPIDRRFDCILGSDILYDASCHASLLKVLDRMLKSDGQACVGDTGRGQALAFVQLAEKHGWQIATYNQQLAPMPKPVRQQFQIFRICRADS